MWSNSAVASKSSSFRLSVFFSAFRRQRTQLSGRHLEDRYEAKRACSAKLAAFERIVLATSSNACSTNQLRSPVTCALHVLSTGASAYGCIMRTTRTLQTVAIPYKDLVDQAKFTRFQGAN
jgi:hypothetical protein